MKKELEKLKKDIMSLHDELYNKGYRAILIDNNYIRGTLFEADLSNFPKRKYLDNAEIPHGLDLKNYGVTLKDNQVIYVGHSHIYIE